MTICRYDTFEDDVKIGAAVEKNKSKILEYVSQPDLWHTPMKVSNNAKDLVIK